MPQNVPPSSLKLHGQIWRGGAPAASERAVPEECPVALSYDRTSFAVMMASPMDLQDFAIGFSISEGIIVELGEIMAFDTVVGKDGIECRMDLAPARRGPLEARRRRIAGPMGCGMCGLDSLQEASRALPKVVSTAQFAATDIAAAMARMRGLQVLNQETHAVHAAGFFDPALPEILLREDVGRHNALDKLIGAVARKGLSAASGAVLLTSRVSLDLIQKATVFGAPLLVAVSVPTALAVRQAEAAGITLVAVARDDGFEVFSHPERIVF